MHSENPTVAEDISVFDYPLPEQTGNRQAKDSLFTALFHEPKYALQLFRIIHPEETDVTEADIQPATLTNIFTTGRYNDLGMLVKDRLIILVEAQSTWNPNMPLRFLLYIADTYTRYISKNNLDIYGPALLKLPKPEFYVVYTGGESGHDDVLTLSNMYDVTVGGDDDFPLQLKVKMLYNSEDGDILMQYMTFCSIYSEQYVLHKGDIKAAVTATLEICENSEVLADYIREHRPEVQNNMITCLQNQDYVTKIHELNVRKEAYAQGVAETEAKYQTVLADKEAAMAEKDDEIARLRAQLEAQLAAR